MIERDELTCGTAAWLYSALISITVLGIGAPPVFASVLISVDKNSQRMSVSVDGAPGYDFVVSTPGYGTPNGIPPAAVRIQYARVTGFEFRCA